MSLIVSFDVRNSYMSNVNFCNLFLKTSMEKTKPVSTRFYGDLTSSISVYCRSNVKSHAGLSIFMCHLSENERFEQFSENFKNGKIFGRQKFFARSNFCRYQLFAYKYFCHPKKNSLLLTDKVFTDKVCNKYVKQEIGIVLL